MGRRVVVRHLLADGSATDVLGELVAAQAGSLRVQPDDGPARTVDASAVVAAKVVPPRAVRPSSGPDAVQRVADLGWPGLERQRLGGWVLRAAGGFTGRANSALAAGDPGVPLDEALETVERFYQERSLPPRVQVPFDLHGGHDPAPGLDAALAARGWRCDEPTLLLVADLRRRSESRPRGLGAPWEVTATDRPDDEWLALYRYRGGALPPVARQVLCAARWQRFVSLRSQDRTLAVGRVAVADGWAGVTAMQVHEDHQRRGLGATTLDQLLAVAQQQGPRFGYLQVAAANTAAVALYEAAGFVPHHRYHYRTAGTGPAAP